MTGTTDYAFCGCPKVTRQDGTYGGIAHFPGCYLEDAFSSSWSYNGSWCEHVLDEIPLTDGTVIRASAHYDVKLRPWEPDLAVYLASSWFARCPAFSIGWPDMAVPEMPIADVLTVARIALRTAHAGGIVEVGCIGAHGRTGTFLAIMELLVEEVPNATFAITHVRRVHCDKAIENRRQEHYIGQVAAVLRGEEPEPWIAPPPIAWKVTKTPVVSKGKAKKRGKKNKKR